MAGSGFLTNQYFWVTLVRADATVGRITPHRLAGSLPLMSERINSKIKRTFVIWE